jgi:hypothetical protein
MKKLALCAFLWVLPYGQLCEPAWAEPLSLWERAIDEARPVGGPEGRPRFTSFLEGGAGLSLLQQTTPDGVWWQSPFPHSFDLTSLALKAGIGVQVTEHWSVAGSYVSLGTAKATTEYVSDHDYDRGHLGGSRGSLTAYDRLQGGQLIVAYRWTQWPMLSGGVAGMLHRVVANQSTEFSGVIPMVVVGGGLCWQWLCGEVTYYRGVQAPHYPISTQAVVPWLSLRVPIGTD